MIVDKYVFKLIDDVVLVIELTRQRCWKKLVMIVKIVFEKISAGFKKSVCSAVDWLPTSFALQIGDESEDSKKKTRQEKENLPLFISVEPATYEDGSSILYNVMLIKALRRFIWCFCQCKIIPPHRSRHSSLLSALRVFVFSMAQPLARDELQFSCWMFAQVS